MVIVTIPVVNVHYFEAADNIRFQNNIFSVYFLIILYFTFLRFVLGFYFDFFFFCFLATAKVGGILK